MTENPILLMKLHQELHCVHPQWPLGKGAQFPIIIWAWVGGLWPRICNSPKSISTARAVNKKTTLILGEDGDKFSIWQMFFGVAGNENTFLCCRSARNGSTKGENSLLETPLLWLMNQRPGVYGRLVESQTFFLGKNGFLRHFRVKIKTPALEQPITKLWLLESVAHWKWFVCFSELFKRLCATHWAFVMFYQTGHSSLFEALRPLWHLLLKQFILSVVYCLM